MSIMRCDNCGNQVDTDFHMMFPFNNGEVCEGCFEETLWENDRFLDRVNDINGWFIESITEQSDEQLRCLLNEIKKGAFENAGVRLRNWVEEYCSEGLDYE